jgi:large subunit ribosomal protein L1
MGRTSKRFREIAQKVDVNKTYSLEEAIDILKSCPPVKFDQTVDIALVLGTDPRKSDQQVRGTVSLPNGTGQTAVVVVLARGEKVQEALAAGADFAGNEELLAKIQGGWTDFSVIVATPDMMRDVGKLGKVLGPRGLMPTPKAGTVTADVATAVKEIKAGKIEFKVDKGSVVNSFIGKMSFSTDKLVENARAMLMAIWRMKPASAKGNYMKSMMISSTMGPGVKVSSREFPSAA